MTTLGSHSTAKRAAFRRGHAVVLILAAIAALALFARQPASKPAPREPIAQTAQPVTFAIVPSPLMGFGPAQSATGDGGQ